MTQEEINKHRDEISLQLKEKVSEIESNISLIIIGALGFFLTVNEKFIGLKDASLLWLCFLSVALLLVSFFIYLYNKHLTTKFDREIIDFIDDKMKPDNKEANTTLYNMWQKGDTTLERNKTVIYWTLSLGILFQVIFFIYNVLYIKKNKSQPDSQKLEIIIKDSTNKIILKQDTIILNHKNKNLCQTKK